MSAHTFTIAWQIGIVAWFVTSAKDGANIDEGFQHLAGGMLRDDTSVFEGHSRKVPFGPKFDGNHLDAGYEANAADGARLFCVWDIDDT
jgi:hypothetical protein